MNSKPNSIQEYISWLTPEIQAKVQQMREILRQAVPEAKEVISYHMPAFKTTEVSVYYAAAKSHLGYYPTSSGVINFKGGSCVCNLQRSDSVAVQPRTAGANHCGYCPVSSPGSRRTGRYKEENETQVSIRVKATRNASISSLVL